MVTLLLAALLAALLLTAVSLQKTYFHLPNKELKRRARADDEVAALLYRAAANGRSLDVLLWLVIGLSAGGFFLILAREFPPVLALLGSVAIIWAGFAWLPTTRVTGLGLHIAQVMTPPLAWVLDKIGPVLDRLIVFIRSRSPVRLHTGLYQKEDLIELIETQQVQADNRITEEELQIAMHALSFGDKFVREIMVPRKVVKMVAADETVGPILMDELHKSGHSRFPVFGDDENKIVGTLFLRDLMRAKQGGKVAGAMSDDVFYVHDEQSLYAALQAFLKTKHHLFVVVNRFEECVGILTIEDVIEQIIGKPIVDEFDKYDDMRAVAGRYAKQEHDERVEREAT